VKSFKASDIDFITWSLREAEYPRAQRRVRINEIANGVPPFSEQQAKDMRLPVNFNDLSHLRECHNARAQFTQSFMKPGAFFNCRTDAGRKDKVDGYGRTATKEVAKVMKRSLSYFETHRSKWAATVLHGISPCAFRDSDRWNPRPIGIDDVLIPSNTELSDIAEGTLPLFAIYRSLKAPELIRMAKGPKPDPAWNQDLVNACLKWVDEQTMTLAGTNYYPDYLSPEKWEERIKGDGGMYASDQVPTINVLDFYFWNDDDKVSGWNRRMILDAWSMPKGPTGVRTRRSEEPFSQKDQFLYDPGSRKWASNLSEIINWQFADLSAVSPFRYHTVRSLGYLLYAVCHYQNRLRCKFTASMFEQLMVLMRVRSQDDVQRALSVNLVDYGFVDDSIQFIPAAERYQVNAQLAQLGLSENANLISRNSSSFTAKIPSAENNKVPTATQYMGEEAKVTQLVGAGLQQAYEYQKPEYREIFRRLTRKGSVDPDARTVQANCLKAGIPPAVLYNLAAWEIEPERVVGQGNKTLEMMVADWLVGHIQMYDPDAQRRIKQIATLSITDDAALTDVLVPESPRVSDSIHDAQLAVGTLLIGQPMAFRENVNHGEYASALLDALEVEIVKINAAGGIPETSAQLIGLQNLAGVSIQGQPIPGNGAAAHIGVFSQDPEVKAEAKMLNDRLGKMMNEVKAFAQRLQEKQQSQNGDGQPDAETMAKVQSMLITAQAKAENTKTSHAQRTAQKQVQFEMEQEQKQARAAMDLQVKAAENRIDLTAQAASAELEVAKEKKKAEQPATTEE